MNGSDHLLEQLRDDLIEEGCSLCSGLMDIIARTKDPRDKALMRFTLDRLPDAYPKEVREWLNEEMSKDMD